MLSPPTKLIAILVTAGVVLGGVAGVVGAGVDDGGVATSGAAEAPQSGVVQSPVPQPSTAQAGAEPACAVDSPASLGDPPTDVLGWENGTWYDEPIAVDQSDGLNRSEQAAFVDRTMARVEAIRCTEFDRDVPVSVISREEFREQQMGQRVSPELRTFDNAKFEALFLVGEDADSIEVQRENLGASVLGYYSPANGEIVLVAESREQLQVGEFTLAHELMHALQDQEFDLSSAELSPQLRDEANARNGLVEGSARYVERLYEQRCRAGDWNGTCRPVDAGGAGDLANVGIYLMQFQPYADGPEFVRTARTMGGWEAVDALYEQPPASTEQVIHVEKYGVDEPTDPDLQDRTTDGWTRVEPPGRPNYASVGEAAVMTTFVYPYYDSEGDEQVLPPSDWLNYDEQGNTDTFDPYDYESNYSAGWDGDRLHVYRNGTDETAYVWRLAWDSPQDAREFVDGYRQILQYWGAERVGPNTYRIADGEFADAFHVSVEGTSVTVVNAPTVDQLSSVRTDVDATGGGNATAHVATSVDSPTR